MLCKADDSSLKRNFMLFVFVGMFLGMAGGITDSTLNNFLNDSFHISPEIRGWIEFPRELPGLLVAFISAWLFFMPDIKMAMLANIIGAVGLIGLAFFSPNFGIMMIWLISYSLGLHIYLPLSSGIGMSLAEEGQSGKRLGQLNAINTFGSILGFIAVFAAFRYAKNYRITFIISAAAYLTASLLLYKMHAVSIDVKKPRFVWNKRYSLFYLLNILYGARKQVFITFAPWVLIKVFGQSASTFAVLGLLGAVVGIGFKALLGKAIDVLGERWVLMGEALLLILVCLGYGFSNSLGAVGLYIAYICYMLDQMLMAAGMARATYLQKIAVKPEDITATLATGVSLDHAVSMLVPSLGGFIWEAFGYQYVFIAAACIAIINLISAAHVKVPRAGALVSSVQGTV